jgi:serine/threonine protein kinase
LLGQGGFADVFLYQQRSPRRRVALKVLLPEVIGPEAIARLSAEADAMAELSNHPHIVTVYGSGVSDDGRPYLALEYCPNPSLGVAFRTTQRSVADVVAIGVQIAGAVETAHRAGILHRDIKPANILVTQYGNPALTDFGIAMDLHNTSRGGDGLSVPFSPPEAFATQPWVGPQTDVWGLCATLYSLLAKRAPFEIPGGDNEVYSQMHRIQKTPLPPVERPDVPASLQLLLHTGLAKDPAARYPSALALGRALQRVQTEMQLQPTRLVIEATRPAPPSEDDDEPATHLRGPVTINPAGAEMTDGSLASIQVPVWDTSRVPLTQPVSQGQTTDQFGLGTTAPVTQPVTTPPVVVGQAWSDVTMLRGQQATVIGPTAGPLALGTELGTPAGLSQTPLGPSARGRRRRLPLVIGGAIGLLAVGVGLAVWLSGPGDTPTEGPTQATGVSQSPPDIVTPTPPDPENLQGTYADGQVTFTWTNPAPEEGDKYRWAWLDNFGDEIDAASIPATTVTITPADKTSFAGDQVCLSVSVVRNGRLSAQPARACVALTDPGGQ